MKICSVCQSCYEDAVTSCVSENHPELVASRPGGRKISAKYRLDTLLERSLTGETYQATDVASNKSLVIKLIDPNLTGDLMLFRERLNTELRAAADINHPNVASVSDYGVLGNNEFYIATELTRGQTLREYLKETGSLPEATAIIIARQAAEGLEAAHSLGIIHRSVSPANIFIVPNEQDYPLIRLGNFDFGGIMQRVVTVNASNAEPYLEAFRYFSPEQCAGQTVDARTDIYSLGVVLYEMLSGGLLFDAPTTAAIVNKKINEQPPPLNHLHFDLKALLTHTLMRSLNKRPDLRPQTAANFARNLRHLEYITKQSSAFFKRPPVNQPAKIVELSLEKPLLDTEMAAPVDNTPAEQSQLPQTLIPITQIATALNTTISPAIEETVEAAPFIFDPIFNSEPIYIQKKGAAVAFTSEPILIKRKNVSISPLASDSIALRTKNADVVSPSQIKVAAAFPEEDFIRAASSNSRNSYDLDETPFQKSLATKRPSVINVGLIAILAAIAILGAALVAALRSEQLQTEQATVNSPASGGSASEEPASTATDARTKIAESSRSKGGTLAATIGKQDSAAGSGRNNRNESSDDALTSSIKARQNAQSRDVTRAQNGLPTTVETSNDSQARQTAKSDDPEAELGTSLNKWIEATNSGDVNQQMNYYAPKVNSYYQARNATQETVKAEKRRIFENAAVDIRTSKPEIVLSNDGQSAKMRFHKKYVIKKGQQNRSGEVIQELQWVKSKNGWKIVSERDVKVINP